MELSKNEDYVNPETGQLRSYSERRERERQRAVAAERVSAEAKRMTERPQSDAEQRIAGHESYVAHLRSKLRMALPSEKVAIQQRIAQHTGAIDDVKAEVAEQSRLDARAKNPSLSLALEHAQGLRNWKRIFPHAAPEAIELARAVLADTTLPPSEVAAMYWRQMEIVSDSNAAEQTRIAEIAQSARFGAEAEEAKAAVSRLEAERQRQIVRDNSGD